MTHHASMNRAYSLVWNDKQQAYVAAPETARRRGKNTTRTIIAAAVAVLCNGPAQALDPGGLPRGGVVTAGQATIGQSGNSMTIRQASGKAAIDWQSFNIGSNAQVNFVQPSANAIALNRVVGQDASQILGALHANGQVFILNPNGVLFAPGAQVSAAGVLASTRGMSNEDFMAGRLNLSGSGAGTVVNEGSITAATGGYVVLVGAQVRNSGAITAQQGDVHLAAANQVSLQIAGAGLTSFAVDQGTLDALAENHGLIKADGGRIFLTADALNQLAKAMVNNTGVIEAQTVENRNGTIVLKGDLQHGTLQAGGTLDASAPAGGDGGFIETSAAHVQLAPTLQIRGQSTGGKAGTWLIDPLDFTIAASGGDMTGAQLSSNLAGINVTIQSSSGAQGTAGNINVNDVVSWGANKLTLNAQNNINVNANMNGSGGALLALEYGQGAVASGNTSTYNLASNVKIGLPSGNTFSTKLGSNGTVSNFYVINSLGAAGSATTTDLQGMRAGVTGNYALGADIDASATSTWQSGQGFTFIGTQGNVFSGNFEGLGHAIDALYENWAIGYVGLFGKLGPTGRVGNLHLTNVNISGGLDNVGGLVGYNDQGLIEHVTVQGKVSGGNNAVGGVVGFNDGKVTDAHAVSVTVAGKNYATGGLIGKQSTNGQTTLSDSSGTVSGFYDVGGLIGSSSTDLDSLHSSATVNPSGGESGGLVGRANGKITNSYATGNVTAPNGDLIGGLVGQADGVVSGSYATGNVSAGSGYTGGLIGKANSNVSNSHASGKVDGAHIVGGLVGMQKFDANIADSYATGNVSGTLYSVGGLVGLLGGSVHDSYATGNVKSTTDAVGGLVGSWSSGTAPEIKDSYATGTVDGRYAVGGLVGDMSACYCFIKNSHASGKITATADYVGGLVGYVDLGGIIDSWATGEVSGINNVGGLAGQGVDISNSYATGKVSGETNIGGLVGLEKMGGTITSGSYATGNVNGTAVAAGGLVGRNEGTVTGNSYSTSLVVGVMSVGGLVGENYGAVSDAATGYNGTAGPVVTGATGTGGLIGYNNGSVSNGTATGAVSGASDYTGGLIGFNDTSGSVTGSKASGLVSGKGYVGGLIGENDGTVGASYFDTATVNGADAVGGLVGYNKGAINGASYTKQDVTGTGNAVGGLVGHNAGTIGNGSYANGVVTGYDQVGGLIGFNSAGSVSDVAAVVGTVNGHDKIGGLVGALSGGTITSATAAGAVSGNSEVGGFVGNAADGSSIYSSKASGAVSAVSMAGGFVGNNGTTLSGSLDILNGNTTSSTVTVTSGQIGGFAGVNSGMLTDIGTTNNISLGTAVQDVGGIVGVNNGTLQNSRAGNTVDASKAANVGGAVGRNDSGGIVTKTYAVNSVTGQNAVGGLVGDNNASISIAYASGSATGQNNVGGLIGKQDTTGSATNVYATTTTGGTDHVGGLIGYGGGTVSYSYATGTVTGSGSHVGGLVGSTNGATVSNSVFSLSGTGLSHSTGDYAVAEVAPGKTAAEMMSAATYAGWDLSTTGSHDKIWRSYDGLAAPLLVNWLTPFTVTATGGTATYVYDGTVHNVSASNVSYSSTPDPDLLLGTTGRSGKNVGVYMGSGHYSIQQGYDIISTISSTLTITPAPLTATVGAQNRAYDGTTTASLAAGQVVLTGFFGSDSATSKALTGNYNSKDVATATSVSFALTGGYLDVGSGTLLSNYSLPETATAAGTLTRLALGATLGPVSKTYDGTTSIALNPSAFTLNGFISGEGATVSAATGSFNSRNVKDATTVTASVTGATGTGETDLGNYILPTQVTAAGAITPRALTVTATATDKVYDGNVSDAVALSAAGVLDGDRISFSGSGAFSDRNVGTGKSVTASGITASGADAGNYSYNSSAGSQASITPRQLTLNLLGPVIKVVDGNTDATLAANNYNVGNVVAGESVTVSHAAGQYEDALVGSGKVVTTTLAAADYAAGANTALSNYIIVTGGVSGAVGTIAPAGNPNATVNSAGITGDAGSVSLPLAFNGVVASLPTPATGGDQQAAGANGSEPIGTVTTTAADRGPDNPMAPALASAVSANTRENLLFRRAFSIGDGGIRLPQGVRGSEKDASQ
jgi:filamentous hemagglutinin family protein